MERHYVFKLVDGVWVQCSGWYPVKSDCEFSLQLAQEIFPDDLFTVMTQSGELI